MNEQIEYIEFTKNCGDCGRRFKEKYAIPKKKAEYNKLINFYREENLVCCPKCSDKHFVESVVKNCKRKKK